MSVRTSNAWVCQPSDVPSSPPAPRMDQVAASGCSEDSSLRHARKPTSPRVKVEAATAVARMAWIAVVASPRCTVGTRAIHSSPGRPGSAKRPAAKSLT